MVDADDALPAAATVVLLRDADDPVVPGVEALLLRRPDRGSFAGAWVFPGGRVDADDAGADEDARALSAAIRETREETGLALAPDDLAALSHWTPPEETSRRYRTWFFVARAPQAEVVPSRGEVEEHRWLRPSEALEAHAEGDLLLFPPTWVTLHALVGAASVDDAIAGARAAGVDRFVTVHDPAAARFLWHGDEAYGGEPETPGGARHRLDTAEPRWRYERG
ncbi:MULTISPECIES: NUDIX domain-containing protein [unclassified Agrococcus]|uniref:NUDIX hydrolase n=1 Tax=unclassified Agrococcus TaxID=2615065 RepID=UPI0036063106